VPLRIVLIVLTAVVALGIGLILRRLLVRRLRKTILDDWLVETIGIILIFPPLIIAAIFAPAIWDSSLLAYMWNKILLFLHIDNVSGFVGGLIETILIIVLGLGIARTVMKFVVRGLGESHIDINIRTLMGRIFYIITVIIVIFWVLAIWQISITLPVALLGTLTVAFTFAVQDILKDLVAGFYILLERPFHIGDIINVGDPNHPGGRTGHVENVEIRATKLRLTSGEQVTIPNALVFGGIVVNNVYYGDRRSTITMTMVQDEYNKEETAEKILKAVKEIETVMVKPEPAVFLSAYTGTQITLTIRFWIANGQIATVSEVMYTLRTLFPTSDLTVVESAGNE
jgi:small-conductance mechanosensitive channel